MGGFMTVAGVAGVKQIDTERALRDYAAKEGGKFTRDPAGLAYPYGIVITPGTSGRLSIMYPAGFLGSEKLAASLSTALAVPVLLFHIHDGDLWMYWLFVAGKEIDHFNPVSEYFQDDPQAKERKRCAGNALKLVQHWPGLKRTAIERYFKPWKIGANTTPKAYPDDLYAYGDCNQLQDFMRRLGLTFPLNDDGDPVGKIYRFSVPEPEIRMTKKR